MPSSLIFAGLVVLWLLILVPAVARRQQEVARLSPAVLSGRVLERPMRHRLPEVDMTERRDDGGATTVGELAEQRDDVPSRRERDAAEIRPGDDRYGDGRGDEPRRGTDPGADLDAELDAELAGFGGDRDGPDGADPRDGSDRDEVDGIDGEADRGDEPELEEDDWQAPATRYRPGRGGFDPEAAADAAHAKYAFRQRLVLALLVLLLAAGALALLVSGMFWWAAGGLALALAGYLTYLRRQVRIEESIRVRRTERLAGSRRPAAADDPELDGWARRGRAAADGEDDRDDRGDEDDDSGSDDGPATGAAVETDDDEVDWTADDGEAARVRGTGEPLGVLPARCRSVDRPESTEHESSLPRIQVAPRPPIPSGTSLVDVDDDEQLDAAVGGPEHRRAVGE